MEGQLASSSLEKHPLEAKFPKTIPGKTLGERTYFSCEVRSQGETSLVVVDAYPLEAVERKLMFGVRKGVTQTVVSCFSAHLDHNPGLPPK